MLYTLGFSHPTHSRRVARLCSVAALLFVTARCMDMAEYLGEIETKSHSSWCGDEVGDKIENAEISVVRNEDGGVEHFIFKTQTPEGEETDIKHFTVAKVCKHESFSDSKPGCDLDTLEVGDPIEVWTQYRGIYSHEYKTGDWVGATYEGIPDTVYKGKQKIDYPEDYINVFFDNGGRHHHYLNNHVNSLTVRCSLPKESVRLPNRSHWVLLELSGHRFYQSMADRWVKVDIKSVDFFEFLLKESTALEDSEMKYLIWKAIFYATPKPEEDNKRASDSLLSDIAGGVKFIWKRMFNRNWLPGNYQSGAEVLVEFPDTGFPDQPGTVTESTADGRLKVRMGVENVPYKSWDRVYVPLERLRYRHK